MMFITKKKFNEVIKQAKDEELRKFEQQNAKTSMERYYDERFREIYNRMDKAFADIDRRISKLEDREMRITGDVPVCQRY